MNLVTFDRKKRKQRDKKEEGYSTYLYEENEDETENFSLIVMDMNSLF